MMNSAKRVLVVDDFDDRGERNFHDLAIGPFNFYTGRCQCLSSLHAAHNAPYAMSVIRNDFDIAFAVEQSKGRQGFCNFH